MGKLTAEWCDVRANAAERFAVTMLAVDATDSGALGFMLEAEALRIAAAALRWYERTETGGDDHAERQAIIAACKEATSE